MRGRGNSFCKNFGREFFSFLQKQQTFVSLNYRFGRHCFKLQTVPACKTLAPILGHQLKTK